MSLNGPSGRGYPDSLLVMAGFIAAICACTRDVHAMLPALQVDVVRHRSPKRAAGDDAQWRFQADPLSHDDVGDNSAKIGPMTAPTARRSVKNDHSGTSNWRSLLSPHGGKTVAPMITNIAALATTARLEPPRYVANNAASIAATMQHPMTSIRRRAVTSRGASILGRRPARNCSNRRSTRRSANSAATAIATVSVSLMRHPNGS
jgi:hypothetical protein